MEQLWAAWRRGYVTSGEKPAGCVFCAAAQACTDEATRDSLEAGELVLAAGPLTFSILNRYPYNNGHLMVVPYAHEADLTALTTAVRSELLDTAARWTAITARTMNADGFNVGFNLGAAAGAGIAGHVHLHVVPRWQGDTNLMPVVAGVKVLPEALATTRDRLRAAWAENQECG